MIINWCICANYIIMVGKRWKKFTVMLEEDNKIVCFNKKGRNVYSRQGQIQSGGQGAMAPPNRWIIMLHNLFKVGKCIGFFFFGSLPLQ